MMILHAWTCVALLLCESWGKLIPEVNVGTPDPSRWFSVQGVSSGDSSGRAVSTAGDVNNDGIVDLIIGAITADIVSRTDAGIAYVVFGRRTYDFSLANFQLSWITSGSPLGFRILGLVASSNFGHTVASVGDVNGDGIGDIMAGGYSASYSSGGGPFRTNAGIACVIFGRDVPGGAPAFTDVDLLGFATSKLLGFSVAAAAGDYAGVSVTTAGDFNGDGVGDIIMGAYGANGGAGGAYVIYGRNVTDTTPPFANIDLLQPATFPAAAGFRINGAAAGDIAGLCVSGAGDVNGDGVSDILVGARDADPLGRSAAGITYVLFGRNTATGGQFSTIALSAFVTSQSTGFFVLGAAYIDNSAISVSAAGDVNGDGVSDIIVGAHGADALGQTDSGTAYVIFGKKVTSSANAFATIDLNAFTSVSGFRIFGAPAGSFLGFSVSEAGDVNADGIDDVIIGTNTPLTLSGSAYVVFGRKGAQLTDINLNTWGTTSAQGFRIRGGLVGNNLGVSVSTAGDVNQDGVTDVIVGASASSTNTGISYVIFGVSDTPTSQPSSQPSRQPSAQPSRQPSRQPSAQPSSQPSSRPSAQPSSQPSAQPTRQPSARPSGQPSVRPSVQPSRQPSAHPSSQPSSQPSRQPSNKPSSQPSAGPSGQPTSVPTNTPSLQPVAAPTAQPSVQPSTQPTNEPTAQPSRQPSTEPSSQPSCLPSTQPASRPSCQPTSQPTGEPSAQPTCQPTARPSVQPSARPSEQPSAQPSRQPSAAPTSVPSGQPGAAPTSIPSGQPSVHPSSLPTSCPSSQPSTHPTSQPSVRPTAAPSTAPTGHPTTQPTRAPSTQPTRQPSAVPSSSPSTQPTSLPTDQPTSQPSNTPSASPTTVPTITPSTGPSSWPTKQPRAQPTALPSSQPTVGPTTHPSSQPLTSPSGQPTSAPSARPTVTFADNRFVQEMSALKLFDCAGALCICGARKGPLASCLKVGEKQDAAAEYHFDWEKVQFMFVAPDDTVIINAVNTNSGSKTGEVALCTPQGSQLQCAASSMYDATILAASYVPYPNKVVLVGWYNVHTSITVLDRESNSFRSYLYSASNTKALTLSHVLSPPYFVGSFVAGKAIRATATPVNYIVAGMVRTEAGTLKAMVLMPETGDIVNSVNLVTAMALENTGPDSFIAGGLQISDSVVGQHAYLVRANALFMSVQYCMRYVVRDGGSRRTLITTSIAESVVRAMVLADSALFLIVDRTVHNVTSLTVLKVDAATGGIVKQRHVSVANGSVSCTDIVTVDALLYISCTVRNSSSVLLIIDKELSFTALPTGFAIRTHELLQAQRVNFKRTVLTITKTDTSIATTRYEFSTAASGPTRRPSTVPTHVPSVQPSSVPSAQPSSSPTATPTVSARPTSQPSSAVPTNSQKPTVAPSVVTTERPSATATVRPSLRPTIIPTVPPTLSPSALPTLRPTPAPTLAPSCAPITRPSCRPVVAPTRRPSAGGSTVPTVAPSEVENVTVGDNRNSMPKYVTGASIGGGLALLLGGYLLYKYYQLDKEAKDREVRKVEYFARQALLAEQTRAETAKYIQEETDRLAVMELEKELRRADKRAIVRGAGAGAYSSGQYSDSSSVLLSSLHSSEYSEGDYTLSHSSYLSGSAAEDEHSDIFSGGEGEEGGEEEGVGEDWPESDSQCSHEHTSDGGEGSGRGSSDGENSGGDESDHDGFGAECSDDHSEGEYP